MNEDKLAVVPPALPQEQSGIHWMQVLAGETDRLIASIRTFSDETLFDMLNAASAIEHAGWKLRCAASAELLERAVRVRVRREGDQTGEGRMALAKALAARTNVSVSTVLSDAEIWQTFFTAEAQEQLGDVSHLAEKTYYVAALRAENPVEVLQELAMEKLDNPSFSTSDAKRLVAIRHSPSMSAIMPSLAGNREIAAAFELWQQATRRLVAVVGSRGRQIANSQTEEWTWELALPDMTFLQRIEHLITVDGLDEIDQIAPRLGVDRQAVISWFSRLKEEGWISYTEKERSPGARGAARKSWYFTDEYYAQKGTSDE